MKKKLLFTFLIISSFTLKVNGQNVTIPDANFKNYLLNNSAINTNGDTEIQLTEANSFAGSINCNFINITISDLTGIEEFTNLKRLECQYNDISTLDLSSNTSLTYINCSVNALTDLTLPSGASLTALLASDNQLSTIDVSNNPTLDTLNVQKNNLTNIDVSANTNLSFLSCGHNELTNLDVTNNMDITNLYCYFNNLTNLDITNNTLITDLGCYSNQLTSLDLTQNINLETINTNFNNLTSLDFSNCTALRILRCKDNDIAELDLSANIELYILTCQSNNLSCLNVRNGNNTEFGSFLGTFRATNNPNLTCIEVDDVAWSESNMTNVDAVASFNTNCPVCTASLNQNENEVKLTIYPNPTTGILHISSESELERIEIINAEGRVTNKLSSQGSLYTVDLSNQAKGIYFVKSISEKTVSVQKVIVE